MCRFLAGVAQAGFNVYAPQVMRAFFFASVLLFSSVTSAKLVTFKAADGVRIQADWFAPQQKNRPVLLAFHMAQQDRSSWKSLQKIATKAGLGLLAVDMRGHGKSAKQGRKDWSKRVRQKDKKLFNQLHKDVAAAVKFVRKRRIDRRNIILVGASVGCSAIIEYASTHNDFAAAILLSPGTQYFGIASLQHIPKWADRPLLMVAPADEVETGANQLYKVMGHHRRGIVLSVPQKKVRGTQMLGKVPRLEQRLVEWAKLRVVDAHRKVGSKKTTGPKPRPARKHPGR